MYILVLSLAALSCVEYSFSWNFPKFLCLSPWLGLFASSSPCERVAQWLVDDVGRNKESHSDNNQDGRFASLLIKTVVSILHIIETIVRTNSFNQDGRKRSKIIKTVVLQY